MISAKIGHSLDPLILKLYRLFFRRYIINPNILTVCGAVLSIGVCCAVAWGHLALGGVVLLVSGALDLMDGALARSSDQVTPFGGFLDSVLDRYSDLLVMCGVLVYFMKQGDSLLSTVSFVAAIGIAIIPYAKARAEAASLSCNTGLLERPERVVILLIGLLCNLLPYAAFALAVLTHVTVLQRILYVKRQIR
ncbi:CDP-alcohol phosphatidyltransferase family protein [Syntrophorhabdus aromaticivorans]|uniref:CDP-alcohol phosphatidyltransferase family protein n=1 Tax=Syntrophorhabdus aromaticivorans TaxID=328301 RepID=A0A971S115_9BACT|nr:CDP-alcohol phosphatidyltransferase family protein [Syntrophorhabdus aromaticivorans]NLW35990.1 CDP-alcohol phosphatidyltransferase family protein [Syntrophorhabdus aromaticivorans]